MITTLLLSGCVEMLVEGQEPIDHPESFAGEVVEERLCQEDLCTDLLEVTVDPASALTLTFVGSDTVALHFEGLLTLVRGEKEYFIQGPADYETDGVEKEGSHVTFAQEVEGWNLQIDGVFSETSLETIASVVLVEDLAEVELGGITLYPIDPTDTADTGW